MGSTSRPVFSIEFRFIQSILLICCTPVEVLAAFSQAHLSSHNFFSPNAELKNVINYKTYYFDQQIDHFGFAEDSTFKQRYLVADYHWHYAGGPILFYTGNEGDITWFCNNTGFMWDVAEELGAMLVFAEHRYYGESLPFGDQSYRDAKTLNFLTSEQALADFAVLIKHLKKTIPGTQNSSVIAIGGSYGGMLAAWLRMKYPYLVTGALASSAPIWQFEGLVDCGIFYKIVTDDFTKGGKECSESIRRSWKAIDNVTTTVDGLKWLSETFHLCSSLTSKEDIASFKSWLSETWVNLAMVNYPYEANFLQPLPAWPVEVVCKFLQDSKSEDKKLLQNIFLAASIYYNYTGNVECLNTSQTATGSLGYIGWYYQACTEMVMPMCSDGINDMFEPQQWDLKAFSDECYKQFGKSSKTMCLPCFSGYVDLEQISKLHSCMQDMGVKLEDLNWSNGGLDPWSGGGVTTPVPESLVVIMIPEGAHHLDLRYNSAYDPKSVLIARYLEVWYMKLWIKEDSIKLKSESYTN
ncbi:PCP carboxypeptidase, partial [Polypterus senegalus]|nr:PCP carboxypeptidase [Polypterus senegalus]